mgnify:CR=1 FL=1
MSHIDCRREGAIGLIVLNRPDKLNAFAGTMREDILKAAKQGAVEAYRDAVRRYYEEIIK